MKLNVRTGYRIDNIKLWGMTRVLRNRGKDRDRSILITGPPLTSTQGREGEETLLLGGEGGCPGSPSGLQ